MENLFLVVVLGLSTLVAAHYEGYPFVHANNGRYGVQYKVANYKEGQAGQEGAAPVRTKPALAGKVADGKRFGFLPSADNARMEFDFRKHSGFPVHLGNGQFYFLGDLTEVSCEKSKGNGFYFTGDIHSYTVCENGRTHKFNCAKGTRNKDITYFRFNEVYDRSDLCNEHDDVA